MTETHGDPVNRSLPLSWYRIPGSIQVLVRIHSDCIVVKIVNRHSRQCWMSLRWILCAQRYSLILGSIFSDDVLIDILVDFVLNFLFVKPKGVEETFVTLRLNSPTTWKSAIFHHNLDFKYKVIKVRVFLSFICFDLYHQCIQMLHFVSIWWSRTSCFGSPQPSQPCHAMPCQHGWWFHTMGVQSWVIRWYYVDHIMTHRPYYDPYIVVNERW
jgi:hypothetical protein